jgi:hypothetical protein
MTMKTVLEFLAYFFRANLRTILAITVVGILLGLVAVQAFLVKEEAPRTLADLTPGERLYVERMVLLERAKAVALVNRTTGEALLDSLAAAWGDSSLAKTLSGVPTVPERSAAVAELLRRIIDVEHDSLRTDPGRNRLAEPVADPPPPPPEPAPEPAEDQES